MRFKSEEEKLNFLGLLIKDRYSLFDWVIDCHIKGLLKSKKLKKIQKELLFCIHSSKIKSNQCL
jgi:hypothetical protein